MEKSKISEQEIQAFIKNLVTSKANEEEWLTFDDATKYLHISKRTMFRYRNSANLHYSKIGRKVYFKKSDLLELLAHHYV